MIVAGLAKVAPRRSRGLMGHSIINFFVFFVVQRRCAADGTPKRCRRPFVDR